MIAELIIYHSGVFCRFDSCPHCIFSHRFCHAHQSRIGRGLSRRRRAPISLADNVGAGGQNQHQGDLGFLPLSTGTHSDKKTPRNGPMSIAAEFVFRMPSQVGMQLPTLSGGTDFSASANVSLANRFSPPAIPQHFRFPSPRALTWSFTPLKIPYLHISSSQPYPLFAR
jgi:hypothetical protein